VAAAGDPLVLGMFEGAGAAMDDVPLAIQAKWAAEVVAVEEDYIAQRRALDARTCEAMQKLFAWAVESPAASKASKE
jgi:hypothetical protein